MATMKSESCVEMSARDLRSMCEDVIRRVDVAREDRRADLIREHRSEMVRPGFLRRLLRLAPVDVPDDDSVWSDLDRVDDGRFYGYQWYGMAARQLAEKLLIATKYATAYASSISVSTSDLELLDQWATPRTKETYRTPTILPSEEREQPRSRLIPLWCDPAPFRLKTRYETALKNAARAIGTVVDQEADLSNMNVLQIQRSTRGAIVYCLREKSLWCSIDGAFTKIDWEEVDDGTRVPM